jgi:hypothetical protein
MSEDEQNKALMKYFTEFCHFLRPQLTYILRGGLGLGTILESDGPELAAQISAPPLPTYSLPSDFLHQEDVHALVPLRQGPSTQERSKAALPTAV